MEAKPALIISGVAAVLVVVLLLVLLSGCVCWGVPAGHVGVVSSFGSVADDTLPAGGPYLVAPWKKVTYMSCQTQKNEEHASAPTKNGLTVQMTAVLLYQLKPGSAPNMLRQVGENYEERIVDPYFKNAVRDVCAEYEPEALYTVNRKTVEEGILTRIRGELEPLGIEVKDTMLQDPQLPPVVTERIQAKVAAEQDAIRMQSVFKQREQEALANKRQKELDAEAKVIEAKGIAEAQQIIKKDLDDNYLRYLWIEALKESAKHNNATIYVPTGSDGMPFFKNVQREAVNVK